jgi:uncharacterized membrane protein
MKVLSILTILLIASTLSLFSQSAFGLTAFLWLFILFPATGCLLIDHFYIKKRLTLGEWVGYILGFSLLFLILFGLVINSLGLIFHYRALETRSVVFSFIIAFILLIIAKHLQPNRVMRPQFMLSRDNKWVKAWFLLPLIFPILSFGGAMRLNNGASNSLALFTIFIIIIYQITTLLFFKKRSELSYIINLVCTAFALTISVSLRSNYLVGYDISQEYRVFNTVLENGIWHPRIFADNTYNACLSITILPALIHSLIPISPLFIFKFIMQFITAFIPVIIFNIARRQLSFDNKLAFASSLFFIVQTQYIFQLPALIRQGTAFIMAALIIDVISNRRLPHKTSLIIMSCFGIGVVLSHYSSTYVLIGLFSIGLILKYLLSLFRKYRNHSTKQRSKLEHQWYLPPAMIVILVVSSVLWYGQVIGSSGDVTKKLSNSFSNIQDAFSAESIKKVVGYFSSLNQQSYDQSTINDLIIARRNVKGNEQYPDAKQAAGSLQPIYSDQQYAISGIRSPIAATFDKLIPIFIKIILCIGIIYTIYLRFLRQRSEEEAVLIVAGCLLLGLLVVMPGLSENYNFERMYQQLLILLSGTFVAGLMIIFKNKSRLWVGNIACFIVIGYFLSTSGFARQIITQSGDINFNNQGLTYDRFYTSDNEFYGLKWLNEHKNKSNINTDRYAILRAQAYTGIPIEQLSNSILPTAISRKSYVYVSNANKNKNIAYDTYKQKPIMYNFPQSFLDNTKNTIYSNQRSAVYK